MSTIPSPEQQKLLSAYKESQTLVVKYIDQRTAMESALQISKPYLLDKQPIAFIIDNQNTKDELDTLLASYNLDKISYEVNSFAPLSDRTINYLRAHTKITPDVEDIVTYHMTSNTIDSKRNLLIEKYENLFGKAYGDYDLRHIISYALINNFYQDAIDLTSIITTYSKEKYYKIKKAIQDISNSYEDVFDILNQVNTLKVKESNDGNSTAELVANIQAFLISAKELQNRYKHHKSYLLNHFSMESKLSRVSDMETLIDAKRRLLKSNIAQELSSKDYAGFSLIKKKLPSVNYVEIVENALAKLNLPISVNVEISDFSTAINFIEKCEEIIDNNNESSAYKLRLSRINKLNTNDSIIRQLDTDLNEFVTSLNKSGLFNHKHENNALSFDGQIIIINKIVTELSQLDNIFRNYPQYLNWISSHNQHSTEVIEIVKLLQTLPKNEWISIFEKSYFTSLINNVRKKGVPAQDESLEELWMLLKDQNQLFSNYLDYQFFNKRQSAVENLKSKNKSIYQYLYKKNSASGMSYMDLYQKAPEFINAFFPIQVYNRAEENLDSYTAIVNFSSEGSIIENAVNYHPMEQDDFDSIDFKTVFPLYLNDYNYQLSVESLSNVERLKAAKKLAKMLLSITQDIKLYQLKNANIISTLDTARDRKLYESIKSYGVKVLDDDEIYDRLTESIIETGRSQILISQDGILSPDSYNDFLWHHEVISLFNTAGIKNINISTIDEYDNPKLIQDLLHKHLFQDVDSHSIKSSLVE